MLEIKQAEQNLSKAEQKSEQESEQAEQEIDKLYKYIEHLEGQISSQLQNKSMSSILGILIPFSLTFLNESGLIPYLLSKISMKKNGFFSNINEKYWITGFKPNLWITIFLVQIFLFLSNIYIAIEILDVVRRN